MENDRKNPANPYGVRLIACYQGGKNGKNGKLVARMATFLSHLTKYGIRRNFQIRPWQF